MDTVSESQMRDAVATGEFVRAQALWEAYAAQLQQEVRQGSFCGARLQEVRELVEWSRVVALCARAHAQDQLSSLLVAAEYDSPPSSPARIVQVSI